MPEMTDTRATHDWRRDAMRLAAERDDARHQAAQFRRALDVVGWTLGLDGPSIDAGDIVIAARRRAHQTETAAVLLRDVPHLLPPAVADHLQQLLADPPHPTRNAMNTLLTHPYGPKTAPRTEEAAPETEAASDRITSGDLTGALLGIRTPDPFLTMEVLYH